MVTVADGGMGDVSCGVLVREKGDWYRGNAVGSW